MHFETPGIVVAVEIADIIALMMVSMAAMCDHFVAANQTINCCWSAVAEANRI